MDDLVDAYALGALDTDEVDAVERHLADCASCQALVDAARASAEALLYAVPQVEPPPSLRGRLLSRIAQEKVATSRDVLEAGRESHRQGDMPAERDGSGRSGFRRLLSALRGEPSPVGYAGELLRDLLADPSVAIWPIAGTADAPGARGRFVASGRRREGVLVVTGLRQPTIGNAYQVWLLRSGQPQPNALFTIDRSGIGSGVVRSEQPWNVFDTIAVTMEPREGSPAPTGSIVLAGGLT